jgi:hypothetical protein
MVEQAKWVDLKFSFDYPVGKFPALLERLRGTSIRIKELIKGLSSQELTKQQGESWSIQEHIGHLIDLEVLFGKRIADFENSAEVLTAADMSNKKTYEANYNKASIDDLLSEFKEIRAKYITLLESYDDETIAKTALHPRLNKPMRVVDLAYFFAEHDDNHLAIIRRLKNL